MEKAFEMVEVLDKKKMDFKTSSTLIVDPTKPQETEPEEMKKEDDFPQ